MTRLAHPARNFTLLASGTITVMAGIAIAPALPGLRDALGGDPKSDFLVKVALPLPSLFIALSSFWIGLALNRFRRRPVLLGALLASAVFGMTGSLGSSLGWLLATRAALGVSAAAVYVTSTTLLGDYYRGEELRRYLGLQSVFIGLGGICFLVLGGFLSTAGWRYPFLIYLLPLAICLCGLLSVFDSAPPETNARPDAGRSIGTGARSDWISVAWPSLLILVGAVTYFTIPVQLPFHLKDRFGVGPLGTALAVAIMGASFAASSWKYSRIRSLISSDTVSWGVFLILAAGYFALSRASSYGQTLVGVILCGIGMGGLLPHLMSLLLDSVDSTLRGTAVGVFTAANFLGQFLSPVLFEPVVRRCGAGSGFTVACAATFALSGAFLARRVYGMARCL